MGELGARLRATREARGLTVEDAERDTRISRRYLAALEDEQFELIPAPVYARGFLRSYSQYLGLNPQELLALFPSEDVPDSAGTTRNARPSRENPLPGVSKSRPAWNSPRGDAAHPRASSKANFPGSRKVTAPPVIPAAPPVEPTIGIDIGLPVPARRLDRDPAAAGRAAVALVVAAIAIALIIGIAWLIARSGGGAAETGDQDQTSISSGTKAAAPTATTLAIPRGTVPNVDGETAGHAAELLAAAGYEVVQVVESSPSEPRGTVFDQAPAAGSQLDEGRQVVIRVSGGP